jgi:hypothetical protein
VCTFVKLEEWSARVVILSILAIGSAVKLDISSAAELAAESCTLTNSFIFVPISFLGNQTGHILGKKKACESRKAMSGEIESEKAIIGRRKKKNNRTTEWPREKLTKANKKQSMEEMQKQRKRENYTKRESLRQRNRCPEAAPSLGVA